MKTRAPSGKYSGGRPIRSRFGRNVTTPDRQLEIDLTLAVLCALFPGRELPGRWIGELCGLSHAGIHAIQQRALRKLRASPRWHLARDGRKREDFAA